MTDELKMPATAEEGMEEETRLVVMNLSLPKAIWWAIDSSEQKTGQSSSDELAHVLKRQLLMIFLQTLMEREK